MRALALSLSIVLSLWLFSGGRAVFAEKTDAPSHSKLVSALRARDFSRIRRLGEQMGVHKLQSPITGGDRLTALAAIQASSGAQNYWELLPALSEAALRTDRSIAAVAAEVATELSASLDTFSLEKHEITDYELGLWQSLWLLVAEDKERDTDIRVLSLEVAATLHSLQSKGDRPPIHWRTFLNEKNHIVRSEAIRLLPPLWEPRHLVATILRTDHSQEVALRAGQWLCNPNTEQQHATIVQDAAFRTRLIDILQDTALAIERRVEVSSCLRSTPDKKSRMALQRLLRECPPELRKKLKRQIRAQ